MIKISRESEVNLINVLIDQDIISGKDLPNIKKLSSEGEKTQLEAVFDLKLTDEDKILDLLVKDQNLDVVELDNQTATVTQGTEIPYTTISDGAASTSFKEAALKLEVTPSIVGDGNVLMTLKVNNDSVQEGSESDEPPVDKMEINTRLLVADGDIVVIGGIKKSSVTNRVDKTPKLGDVPVIGNLFKGTANTDDLSELLVFIAPRVL